MKPIPRGRILLIFLIPLIFSIIGFFYNHLILYSLIIDLILFIILISDVLLSIKNLNLEIKTKNSLIFSIGRINKIEIDIHNLSNMPQVIEIKPGLPEYFENKTIKNIYKIVKRSNKNIKILTRPFRRGTYSINDLYIRARSIFGFFRIDLIKKIDLTVEVFPDIKQLNYYLKLVRNDRVYEIGIQRNKWIGIGTDLESLREYQKDDDSKFIDWKASTRINRPVTKVFQAERNNNICIVIDCGRMMTAEQNGLSTLDHAINSLLILSNIAYKSGDSINIIAFSDKIISTLPSVKGKAGLNKIVHFITKLQPEFVESNYNLVFDFIDKTVKKRSLVIFLTDIVDDINYTLFKQRIHGLSKKHLILFILLKDMILSESSEKEANNIDELFIRSASREMTLRRSKAILKLKNNKINVLDILPDELTGPLINKYLEIKSRNRL
jgi:uncharacterized protein (DUF58 family)